MINALENHGVSGLIGGDLKELQLQQEVRRQGRQEIVSQTDERWRKLVTWPVFFN
jgi:hypothetical protein